MTTWFLDFDDTLVVGPITWAFKYAFPKLIHDHHLLYDTAQFNEAALLGQEMSAEEGNELIALQHVFEMMGWSVLLGDELRREVFDHYVPSLFDDTLGFLENLRLKGEKVYILSNNNHAAALAQSLGIGQYFEAVFTPKSCGNARKKPYRDMWDYVLSQGIVVENAVLVGDDPWSEGTFASRCGIDCWIIDRMKRFSNLHEKTAFRHVHSLNEILTTFP